MDEDRATLTFSSSVILVVKNSCGLVVRQDFSVQFARLSVISLDFVASCCDYPPRLTA